MRSDRRPRRLALSDLMAIIAGLAVSLWLVPEGSAWIFNNLTFVTQEHRAYSVMLDWAAVLVNHLTPPILAGWTLTILALTLKDRTPWRRLAREPGFVACAAVALTMLLVGPLQFATARYNLVAGLSLATRFQIHLGRALTFHKGEPGLAVSAAWLTLFLNRRWRARPDFVDRAGRALGLMWIGTIPLNWLLPRR